MSASEFATTTTTYNPPDPGLSPLKSGTKLPFVFSLDGPLAVVTGAASGIGLALVESFVSDGASVVMADIQGERLEGEADRLRATGATVFHHIVDVGDPAAVEEVAKRTADNCGRVDVLCNNAGSIAFGQAWELDLAEWHRVLDVNLLSVVHGVRSFVPLMRTSGDDGIIVNVASMAAFMQLGAVSPYVATKHADSIETVDDRFARVRDGFAE